MDPDPFRVSGLSPAEEQALRASDAIIAISADAIISTDADQRIIRFNAGAEEIFGYTAEEIIGRPIDILIPERYRPGHRQHVENFGRSPVAARRMGERRQISGLRRNGEEFPAEASISKTDIGQQRIFTVVLRDVTDRLRAEQAQRFLAQAGALLAGSLDPDRTLESVATLAVPMLGDWCVIFLGGDGVPLRRAQAIHSHPDRAEEMRRLRDIPFAMKPTHPVHTVLTEGRALLLPELGADGLLAMAENAEHLRLLQSLQPRSLLAVPLKARDRVLGAVAFFFDRRNPRVHSESDLELAEELGRRAALAIDNARLYAEARAAVMARDDVLAVVSHDLGNPLSAIRIGTTVLLKQLPSESDSNGARKQVENIRSSVVQMERLIQDLLDIKRIEAGYLTLEKEKIAVHTLLQEAADTFNSLIAGKELRLNQVLPAQHTHVLADRQRILQVFSNLIGNAVKFTSPGDEISIGADVSTGQVTFSVADSGPGIPQEHLPHLFDRFWQARRTGRHGIGLGLAIVKGIVEAHGGKVSVQSELGLGTTFYFSLPTV
jgi:PAS domain S-box-containing protein